MVSDPCDLSWKEYQNLVTCSEEEFGKWFEAARSWKEPPLSLIPGRGRKWEAMDFALWAVIILAFLLVAGVLGMIALDIFGIPWRQWLRPSIR